MSGRYRTIVADPPWPIDRFPAWFDASRRSTRERTLGHNIIPYNTMTIDDITRLPVKDLAEADKWHVNGNRGGSHLYLWTITEFLPAAYDVADAWGFKIGAVLTWCKPAGRTKLGGIYPSNVEFVLFGRRGSPPAAQTKADSRWFIWPAGRHSTKPAAFYDLVEQVSPGPYLELFARRQRLGWDTWGNEALCHVELDTA